MENGLQHDVWVLRVLGDAFWTSKCYVSVSGIHDEVFQYMIGRQMVVYIDNILVYLATLRITSLKSE